MAEWRRGADALPKGGREREKVTVSTPSVPARTNEDGRYELRHLPAGFFNVVAAVETDDGWLGETNTGQGVEMPVDSTVVTLPDLLVVPATVPLSPPESALLDTLPLLEWEPVPGATLYQARVRRSSDGEAVSTTTPDPRVQTGGIEFFDAPDLYVWTVDAFDDQRQIAGAERARAYVYAPILSSTGAGPRTPENPGWTPEAPENGL
jgi:hypothetical protein